MDLSLKLVLLLIIPLFLDQARPELQCAGQHGGCGPVRCALWCAVRDGEREPVVVSGERRHHRLRLQPQLHCQQRRHQAVRHERLPR